jgi:outer membrane protein insertion porin family
MALLALAWLAGPNGVGVLAQPLPKGAVVREIAFEGLKRVRAATVRQYLATRVGEPYDAKLVAADVQRILAKSRLFDGCEVKVAPVKDGARVTFVLKERPVIQGVAFRGNRSIDSLKLENAIGVRSGRPLDMAEVARGARGIERFYMEEGYPGTKVGSKVEDVKGGAKVIFEVKEGVKTTVTGVRFEGAQAFKPSALKAVIRTRARYLVFFGGTMDVNELAEDTKRLVNFYKDEGFLDVKVKHAASREKGKVQVTFTIEEGPRYRTGTIALAGVQALDAKKLRSAFLLESGQFYSRRSLEHDVRSMLNLYGDAGYVEARIARKPSFDVEKRVVNVTYDIKEGKRLNMDEVVVVMQDPTLPKNLPDAAVRTRKGYTKAGMQTKPETFRKILGLAPGAAVRVGTRQENGDRRLEIGMAKGGLFTKTEADNLVEKLYKRGWFKAAREAEVEPGAGPDGRNLVMRLEEQATGGLTLEAGISSDTGAFGGVRFEQENFDATDWPESFSDFIHGGAFKGGGQHFWVDLRPGIDEQHYSVGLRERWFMERFFYEKWGWRDPVSFSTSARFYTRDQDGDYDETRAGPRIAFARDTHWKRLWSPRFEVSVRAEHIEIDDLDDPEPKELQDEEGTYVEAGPRVSLYWNTTDDAFVPTQGVKAKVYGEVVGGDEVYPTLYGRASWFKTLYAGRRGPHVLNLRGQIGWTGDDAPIFDRFFAGGIDTVRGFEYRGIGPRATDPDDGDKDGAPLGGETIVVGNVEYQFPITTIRKAMDLRGVTFLDVGTVDDDIGQNLRASLGAGLRIRMGVLGKVPMAIDFAIPLADESDDEDQLISFFAGARH